jgi:hypothetical protein
LKIHYGIKEDSDKPASLKKAVRILEGVNKAEELLPKIMVILYFSLDAVAIFRSACILMEILPA